MADGFQYKFGRGLGFVLFGAYLLAAVLGVTGTAYGLDALMDFQAWYFWLGAVIAGLLVLWFVPRPIDVILLTPLAVYGGAQNFGLTYTMAGIIMGLPVLIVFLMSLGKTS